MQNLSESERTILSFWKAYPPQPATSVSSVTVMYTLQLASDNKDLQTSLLFFIHVSFSNDAIMFSYNAILTGNTERMEVKWIVTHANNRLVSDEKEGREVSYISRE